MDDLNPTHSGTPGHNGGRRAPSTERLLNAVTRAMGSYIGEAEPAALFGDLLSEVIGLTDSEYAYIGEVLHDEHGDPYLLTWAISNIAWNDVTRALYEEHAVRGNGLQFRHLDTLFGWGLRDGGRLVVCNDTTSDPRSSGRPEGHPPLDSFLGIPVFRGDDLVGQIGMANRPGGYDEALVEALEPFIASVGHLIEGYRAHRDRQRAEELRLQLQRRHESILDHIHDVVSVLDADGNLTESNLAGTRLLGYPKGYDPAGGVFALLHPDDRALAFEAFAAVMEGRRGPDESIDLRVRAADGSYRTFAFAGDDLRTNPAVGGVMLTAHDITRSREAELAARERSAQLTALLSTLHHAVLFIDRDRRIVLMNQMWRDLFRYAQGPDEMIGLRTPVDQWLLDTESEPASHGPLPPTLALVEDPAAYAADLRAVYAGGVPVLERRVVLRDGRVLERDYLPVGDGQGGFGHLWTYRDITARAQMEAERTRLLMAEQEQRHLVEAQVASLRELDRLKTDFVASVSHELRTPLTSIVNFAELLAEDSESLRPDHQEFLEILRRNADRLSGLVDDLLLVARLESGGLGIEPRPVDFDLAVRAAVDGFGAMCARKGIELILNQSGDTSPALLDAQRFDEVVQNLLSNSVKFTPEGGLITVTARREPGHWVLSVSDTGIGIPHDQLPRLFERFFRSSNALEAGVPGTGLGLAIVRGIVDLHGGTIEVESSLHGTTVTVRFPDAASPIAPEA